MNTAEKTLHETQTAVNFTPKQIRNFWKKVDKTCSPNGCWIWMASKDSQGYGMWEVNDVGIKAHRASWIIHNGPIPNGKKRHDNCIIHHCDNPSCVRPDHLKLASQKENVLDMIAKGRYRFRNGENINTAILTQEDVIRLRADYISGNLNQSSYAKMRGMHVSTINNAIHRKTWKHVN